MAGNVRVGGVTAAKAGVLVAGGEEIEVAGGPRYVSRGGLKLVQAFSSFPIDVRGRTVIDAGASTGGFTDCLLQHGAGRVIAVDVGYGQLAWKLRQDPRVQVLERVNIRYLKCDQLSVKPDFATFDLSFISLRKVLPAVIKCLCAGFEAVALVKPEFEAGRGKVGKGGVVRDERVRREVLEAVWDAVTAAGGDVKGLAVSPARGPKGNVEYLMYFVDGAGGEKTTVAERRLMINRLFNNGNDA